MYGLQIWPVDALFNSRNGRNEQVFCPILSEGGGVNFFGGVGGQGGSTLVMPNLQLKKIPLCM